MGETIMPKVRLTSAQQIKVGAILSYLSIILNIGAGIVYTPWMIHQIGQGQYGLFTLANSLISLFMIDFGLSAATSKYVSEYHVKNQEEKINNFLGIIYKLYFFVDLIILVTLVILYFFIDVIYINLSIEELIQFKVVYCIAALYSVLSFPFITTNGILTAYEKFVQLKLADVFYRILIIIFTVIALINGMGLYALVTINAIVGLLIIVYKLIVIKSTTSVKINFKYHDRNIYSEVFGFSVWTTIASLAQRLIFNITPSILGMVSSATEIAVFGIVTTIESYAFIITNAINGMFMPKISRIYAEEEKSDGIMKLMLKVGRFQFALNGIIVAGFLVLGKNFILLWMGEAYLSAYYGIALVLIPGLFYNPMEIAHTAMVVRNKVKKQAQVNIVMGIINVILSYNLSKNFGVVGACVAICVAYLFRTISLIVIYKKELSLNMTYFIKKCYIKNIPIIMITVLMGNLIKQKISMMGWLGVFINAVILIGIYLCLLIVFGTNRMEKHKIKNIFVHK